MNTIRLATICCFMLALLDEVELKGEEARHIRKKCNAYIRKYPKMLDPIANEAWDLACNYPDTPEWNPAYCLVKMWQGDYFDELSEKVGLNPRYGAKIWDRQQGSLKAKLGSTKIAKYNLEAINKVLYKYKDQL